ncbi:unnamed protein product [Fusarium equiseti]|uniref:Glycan binding protein Y3-like domain-containing protein n=1 Tax=Fusarium equiseti TaxID=61235 RepID=A0A8J2JFJ7_FUSEQ|nr:unnamed protein product [Fusarium equiseti]
METISTIHHANRYIFTILSVVAATVAGPVPSAPKHDVTEYGFDFEQVSENTAHLMKRQERYCYRSGVKFGDNTDWAISRAGLWCSSNEAFGRYRPGQTKKSCYNYRQSDKNHHFVFEMQNIRSQDVTLSMIECRNRLRRIVENCLQGGRYRDKRFNWSVNPKDGRCS